MLLQWSNTYFCCITCSMRKAVKVQAGRLTVSKILITATIALITAFQGYYLAKLYREEQEGLKKETDVAFRDVMYKLQIQRFRKDTTLFKKDSLHDNLFLFDVMDSVKGVLQNTLPGKPGAAARGKIMISVESRKLGNSTPGNDDSVIQRMQTMHDDMPLPTTIGAMHVFRYFTAGRAGVNEPLGVKEVDSAYGKELQKTGITVPYTIHMREGKEDELKKDAPPGVLKTNFIFVGLSKPYAYQASFGSAMGYILNKLKLPIIVGVLLVAVTILSFVFLYRNLLAQQRLAAIKNEFIGNITHELKTPIATVNVAIEALRNFDALQNPLRTREYLDISALELQRLSMLVDKVLKLSMFENREIELKKEQVGLHQLAAEVISGMKLQMEKAGAIVQLTKQGDDFTIKADKLHITSVLYNLLDNALKYSSGNPAITVHLGRDSHFVIISVADNGIGIPAAYKDKVFDKFFRVPSNNHHNIKGYGLGLSYVQHIVMQHGGVISVDSTEGKGSTFTIKLPVFNVTIVSL